MELTKRIREELAEHYARKVHNVTDALDDMIAEKIEEIIDMVLDLEAEVDYQVEELTTPVYTEEQRAIDEENFVLNYQL